MAMPPVQYKNESYNIDTKQPLTGSWIEYKLNHNN